MIVFSVLLQASTFNRTSPCIVTPLEDHLPLQTKQIHDTHIIVD